MFTPALPSASHHRARGPGRLVRKNANWGAVSEEGSVVWFLWVLRHILGYVFVIRIVCRVPEASIIFSHEFITRRSASWPDLFRQRSDSPRLWHWPRWRLVSTSTVCWSSVHR